MLQFDFSEFTELHTPRLLMRKMTENDGPAVLAMRSSMEVMQYIDRPRANTLEEAVETIRKTEEIRLQNTGIAWAICLKPSDLLIGSIGYWRSNAEHHRAEVGYMLAPEYWNKGIVSEALTEVLRFGFEKMNLHAIEGHINPVNHASAKVLTKAGFVQEALFRENQYFEGKFTDSAIFTLLARNFKG